MVTVLWGLSCLYLLSLWYDIISQKNVILGNFVIFIFQAATDIKPNFNCLLSSFSVQPAFMSGKTHRPEVNNTRKYEIKYLPLLLLANARRFSSFPRSVDERTTVWQPFLWKCSAACHASSTDLICFPINSLQQQFKMVKCVSLS